MSLSGNKNQSNAQAEAVAEVPISKRSEDPDPSGHRGIGRLAAQSFAQAPKSKSQIFQYFFYLFPHKHLQI